MRELLDTEQELNSHEQALDDIYNRISRGDEIVSMLEADASCMLIHTLTTGRCHGCVREARQREAERLQLKDFASEVR